MLAFKLQMHVSTRIKQSSGSYYGNHEEEIILQERAIKHSVPQGEIRVEVLNGERMS